MTGSLPTDRSEPLTWELSPTDYRAATLLRYLPFAFVGGYVGILLVAGILALPDLLANPGLLALVVLLALIGGPMSLLYLWPMIRDADQRPPLDPRGWYEGASPVGALLAAAFGTAVMLAGMAVTGGGGYVIGVVVFFAVPFFLLGLLDGEGSLDPEAGTLTYREYTTDLTHVDSVRSRTLGRVTLIWLGYVGGASGPKPRLFVVPEAVSEDVLGALRVGAATDADLEPRAPDPIARAVLVVLGLVCLVVTAGIFTVDVEPRVRTVVGPLTAGLGLLFLLAARHVA